MPEQPAAERTEQPTARRLRKARERGRVPHSQEAMSLATLLALIAALAVFGRWLAEWAATLAREGMSCQREVFTNTETFLGFINTKIADSIFVGIPVLAVLSASAVLAGLAIAGPNFAPGAIQLKFNAINPVLGLQQLFNGKSMVKLLASILKLAMLGIIVWVYLDSKIETLVGLRWAWSGQIIITTARIILGLCIRVCIALVAVAIGDLMYQKWKYIEDLKMSKQEVKQEHRDTEGAPEVKVRIRKMQIQMSMKRMLQDVPKANVVLVNPTHVAVALKYEGAQMDAPVVLAKGADHMAEKIMEIARAYGVPIVRRPELARTIYSTVQIGEAIPQSLYVAVAQVLAMLHRLRRRKRQ